MTPQDPFQSPPLYGRKFVDEACQLATKHEMDPGAEPRAGIDDYVAPIEAHAAAVSTEKERLMPYVRGQLRMIQGPSEADTRPPADARQERYAGILCGLIDRLDRNGQRLRQPHRRRRGRAGVTRGARQPRGPVIGAPARQTPT
ncbi:MULTISPECIES: hypothetical protein [Methylorubrum]|jgi:hypothetical protein|uniref:Uncharacterized protein n=1 Tax=Methylorubrum extorquens (strain ATCC 14718 / DSM 1338 / JCM 2805 / NCIMB 9133 / AM1) TaxID=272630 RepID=C5B3A5_METEA|nr:MULTISPECIES: hypothetical protein [Methylorubrum]ACS38118.1 hypothetical protein MexAM1_META1p0154 [Methylorubrum extorquens AM1]MCP1543844.1 hypothetical protein [Methylorubrum extorquens]MCP1588810.1 hypothetical protein [Methylorubrum extorquens]